NAAKKDQAILAFLLGGKKRVIALYKYGQHLSHQLVEMVKDLLPPEQRPVLHTIPHKKRMAKRKTAAEIFGDVGRNASPYLDDSSPVVAAHVVRSAPVAHVAHVVPAAKVPAPRASAPKGPAPTASAPKKKRSRGGRGRKPKA
ncbi:MAG: hypothetical protein NTW72_07520, partial [Gemmatimonadetes bacterium]|nr:hypothetical protein [Gemmatimonadota bacterium]